MKVTEYLERIELKISQLVLKMQQVDRMNEALVRENQQLQLQLLEKNKHVTHLQKQLDALVVQNAVRKNEELRKTADLKAQLEASIRQLHTCVEWLSNS